MRDQHSHTRYRSEHSITHLQSLLMTLGVKSNTIQHSKYKRHVVHGVRQRIKKRERVQKKYDKELDEPKNADIRELRKLEAVVRMNNKNPNRNYDLVIVDGKIIVDTDRQYDSDGNSVDDEDGFEFDQDGNIIEFDEFGDPVVPMSDILPRGLLDSFGNTKLKEQLHLLDRLQSGARTFAASSDKDKDTLLTYQDVLRMTREMMPGTDALPMCQEELVADANHVYNSYNQVERHKKNTHNGPNKLLCMEVQFMSVNLWHMKKLYGEQFKNLKIQVIYIGSSSGLTQSRSGPGTTNHLEDLEDLFEGLINHWYYIDPRGTLFPTKSEHKRTCIDSVFSDYHIRSFNSRQSKDPTVKYILLSDIRSSIDYRIEGVPVDVLCDVVRARVPNNVSQTNKQLDSILQDLIDAKKTYADRIETQIQLDQEYQENVIRNMTLDGACVKYRTKYNYPQRDCRGRQWLLDRNKLATRNQKIVDVAHMLEVHNWKSSTEVRAWFLWDEMTDTSNVRPNEDMTPLSDVIQDTHDEARPTNTVQWECTPNLRTNSTADSYRKRVLRYKTIDSALIDNKMYLYNSQKQTNEHQSLERIVGLYHACMKACSSPMPQVPETIDLYPRIKNYDFTKKNVGTRQYPRKKCSQCGQYFRPRRSFHRKCDACCPPRNDRANEVSVKDDGQIQTRQSTIIKKMMSQHITRQYSTSVHPHTPLKEQGHNLFWDYISSVNPETFWNSKSVTQLQNAKWTLDDDANSVNSTEKAPSTGRGQNPLEGTLTDDEHHEIDVSNIVSVILKRSNRKGMQDLMDTYHDMISITRKDYARYTNYGFEPSCPVFIQPHDILLHIRVLMLLKYDAKIVTDWIATFAGMSETEIHKNTCLIQRLLAVYGPGSNSTRSWIETERRAFWEQNKLFEKVVTEAYRNIKFRDGSGTSMLHQPKFMLGYITPIRTTNKEGVQFEQFYSFKESKDRYHYFNFHSRYWAVVFFQQCLFQYVTTNGIAFASENILKDDGGISLDGELVRTQLIHFFKPYLRYHGDTWSLSNSPQHNLASWPAMNPVLHTAATYGCTVLVECILTEFLPYISAASPTRWIDTRRKRWAHGTSRDKPPTGYTALHLAAYQGHFQTVMILLLYDADQEIICQEKDSPPENALTAVRSRLNDKRQNLTPELKDRLMLIEEYLAAKSYIDKGQ